MSATILLDIIFLYSEHDHFDIIMSITTFTIICDHFDILTSTITFT